jgi:CRP-like cAMP-binding protein
MMAQQRHSLANIALLQALPATERERIERRCRWRRYGSGETVLESGSVTREVFFVVEGAVSIVNYGYSGRRVVFATLNAGDCVGELSAIDAEPRSANVVAVEDSLLASLPAGDFCELLRAHGEVSFKLLERLTHMVRGGDLRIMELSTLAATARVYAELLRMAAPDTAVPGLFVIRPLPPLHEIASRVSTTRETVARALGQLYPDGVLKRKGRSLYIMDRAKLEEQLKALQYERPPPAKG